MVCLSLMGFVTMLVEDNTKYILFPLSLAVFVLYTFFEDDDKEYRRRFGLDQKKGSWLFPEDNGYDYYGDGSYYDGRNHNSSYSSSRSNNRNKVTVTRYSDPVYKKIVKRCRKSVNITIDKINKEKKDE